MTNPGIMENRSSRRSFLKKAITLTAGASVPIILTNTASSATPPVSKLVQANERVNLACCGIGNQGGSDIRSLYNSGLANIVALCDTDMGAPHTARTLEMFPDAPRYQDFRVMFDEMADEIDAVLVATPDHAHFPITMLAMSLGKHVYVEKPMARTFNEVQLMMDAAERYGVVTQMGNQGHSEANYFQFKTWVEEGIIKDVTSITGHMNNPRRWHGWDPAMSRFPGPQPIPETLDWDTWLMAVGHHDYHEDFINGQWRCWYDFGMGVMGDWGAHILDTAHEFLNLGLPSEVTPVWLSGHNPFFFPMSSTLQFKFPARGDMPPLEINWFDGVDNIPEVPEGYGEVELDPNIPPAAGQAIQPTDLNPGKIIYSDDLIFKGGSHGSTLSIIPEEKAMDMASSLPEVPESTSNHYANFLLACKGEENARSSFDVAGPLSQLFCLGVMAQQLDARLEFDRDTKQITNHPLANKLLVGAPPRKGWEEFYEL